MRFQPKVNSDWEYLSAVFRNTKAPCQDCFQQNLQPHLGNDVLQDNKVEGGAKHQFWGSSDM